MTITASMVKELRERTGAGMMECKKALVDAGGDLAGAEEALRIKGSASADKKAGRIAAEGVVVARLADTAQSAVLLEVNCETDFVAKDENFRRFADTVADTVLAGAPADVDALLGLSAGGDGETVDEARRELIGKIGEKVEVRRFARSEVDGDRQLAIYVHQGGRIGVMVEFTAPRPELGRDIAMHVAASRPLCVSEDQVPESTLAAERDIYRAQAAETGKPPEILEKIVDGRVRKYLKEVTLLGQAFVKDPDRTVQRLLTDESAAVHGFDRYQLGEGLEKRSDDFVAEVMAQAKGS